MSWFANGGHLKRVCPLLMLAWATSQASNETCNNKCQLHDESSACWDEARSYFFQQLVRAVNEYASVEAMIRLWSERQKKPVLDDVPDLWSPALAQALHEAEGPFDQHDFSLILELIRNKTKQGVRDDHASYAISCPVPCNYLNLLWIYLFACACIVIVVAVPVVLLHVYFYRRNVLKYQLA